MTITGELFNNDHSRLMKETTLNAYEFSWKIPDKTCPWFVAVSQRWSVSTMQDKLSNLHVTATRSRSRGPERLFRASTSPHFGGLRRRDLSYIRDLLIATEEASAPAGSKSECGPSNNAEKKGKRKGPKLSHLTCRAWRGLAHSWH